jgi:hydrogenase-4 component B
VAPLALAAVGLLVALGGVALLRRARRSSALPAGTARQAPTWTCGVLPEPAMEYTATSYSKLIRLFYRLVLLPERQVRVEYHAGTPLPSAMHYTGSVTHVLDEHVFGRLHRWAVLGSSLVRRLQNGSLQIYLAYALIGLVVLLAVTR